LNIVLPCKKLAPVSLNNRNILKLFNQFPEVCKGDAQAQKTKCCSFKHYVLLVAWKLCIATKGFNYYSYVKHDKPRAV